MYCRTCNYFKQVSDIFIYHGKVQEMLKNNDVTRPYATMELAWFVVCTIPFRVICESTIFIYSNRIKMSLMCYFFLSI